MKDEIKEIDRIILNVKRKLQFSPERRFVELFNKDEINKLLDYITNLQEENERLKDNVSAMEHNYKLLTRLIKNGESMTQKFENGLKELKEGKIDVKK